MEKWQYRKVWTVIFESGRSSIYKYETGSEELKVLQEIMQSTDGIYGGRFSERGLMAAVWQLLTRVKKKKLKIL